MAGRTALPGATGVVVAGAGVVGASIAYFLPTASDLERDHRRRLD